MVNQCGVGLADNLVGCKDLVSLLLNQNAKLAYTVLKVPPRLSNDQPDEYGGVNSTS